MQNIIPHCFDCVLPAHVLPDLWQHTIVSWEGTAEPRQHWFWCKPLLCSLYLVYSTILRHCQGERVQTNKHWCMVSSNWQWIWCHYARSSEANDSDAVYFYFVIFKLKQLEARVWTIQQWLVYCFDCQGERVRSNQANDPDAWCQEIGNEYDTIMPRALKPMTLRHNVKSQSWGPDAGADTFKIKAFHKISVSICLQKVEILKK